MKLIEFKKYENIAEDPKLNKRKVIIASIIIVIVLIIGVLFGIYVANRDFRNFMDTYILRKNVMEDSLPSIEVESTDNINVYAFDKYVVILDKNTLKEYNSSGSEVANLQIDISNPMFCSNGKYLLIAEKDEQKAYLIAGNKILWEKNLEGKISRISVNENGLASIIITGTTYKSVIISYDNSGKELFKTYLSSTIATDTTISADDKYLSFSEIDTSGTLVQQKVKTVSVEQAKISPENSIINTYDLQMDQLIINIEYQSKNKLLCMCEDGIYILNDGQSEKITEFKTTTTKITFSDIELNEYAYQIEEIIYGPLNQASNVEIINTNNKNKNLYTINGVAKEVYSSEDKIAINLGSEVHFIATNGWLVKKYISTQEVKNIVLSGKIAGIIYKDKIEFLGL